MLDISDAELRTMLAQHTYVHAANLRIHLKDSIDFKDLTDLLLVRCESGEEADLAGGLCGRIA
jgi:hypothetical protein